MIFLNQLFGFGRKRSKVHVVTCLKDGLNGFHHFGEGRTFFRTLVPAGGHDGEPAVWEITLLLNHLRHSHKTYISALQSGGFSNLLPESRNLGISNISTPG